MTMLYVILSTISIHSLHKPNQNRCIYPTNHPTQEKNTHRALPKKPDTTQAPLHMMKISSAAGSVLTGTCFWPEGTSGA